MQKDVEVTNGASRQIPTIVLPDITKSNRILNPEITVKWMNVDVEPPPKPKIAKKNKNARKGPRATVFIGKHSKASSILNKREGSKFVLKQEEINQIEKDFIEVVGLPDGLRQIGETVSGSTIGKHKFHTSYASSDPVNTTPNFSSRIQDIVSDFGSDNTSFDLGRRKVVAGCYVPFVQEISEKPFGQNVVSLFIKEVILKQPPIQETKEIIYLRELYRNCIENEWQIKKAIMKNPLSFAKELVDQFKETDREEKLKTLDEFDDRDLFFKTSLNTHCKGPIDEIANDVNSAENFYIPYMDYRLKEILLNRVLTEATQPKIIQNYLEYWFKCLENSMTQPSSNIRLGFLSVLASGEVNNQVNAYLVSTAHIWLECVCQSLQSRYSSIRDESGIIIAYIAFNKKLLSNLQSTNATDYIGDITEALIRSMEKFPTNFPVYYTALGYFLNYTTYTSLLRVLIELGSNCQCFEMAARWPKLISYAFKYWKPSIFLSTPASVQKLLHSLENAYMQPICRKAAKKAICEMSRALKCKPLLITYYFTEN